MANNKEQPTADVRLEFVGPQIGSATYIGPSGRQYRAGNNVVDKYIDVDAADFDKLTGLTSGGAPLFQRVDLEAARASLDANAGATSSDAAPVDVNAPNESDVAAANESAVADALADASSDNKKKKS